MTPRERAIYLRVQRRAASLSPELQRELFRAWGILRDSLSDAELERLITSGQLDRIVDDALLDSSLQGFRDKIVEGVRKGFETTARAELPRAAVAFNQLNPKVIDAIRELDSRVVNTLKDDIRDGVKAFVENGLRDGESPRSIARRLRDMVGLSPSQAEHTRKYEAKLAESGKYSAERIERMVGTYRRKAETRNAYAVARTAAVDAQRLGQRLTWEDAASKGIVDRGTLEKTWITVGDDRVRLEHQALHGVTVPFDNHYPNGDMVPGESDWNCRCVERVRVKPAKRAA